MKRILLSLALLIVTLAGYSQTVVTFNPFIDNSMYRELPGNSNGLGDLFSGTNAAGDDRRALVYFDVSSIPAGAIITDVSLDLTLIQIGGAATTNDFTIHEVLEPWGEGTSSGTGIGAPATALDATWSHAVWPGTMWTTAGGEFTATADATTPISNVLGTYTFNSAGMVSRVQDWVDGASVNMGWILIGDGTVGAAARFGSRENPAPPVLTVTYCVAPTAVCQDITVNLDGTGNYTMAASEIDGGSSVDCGPMSLSADITSFSCSDITTGPAANDLIITGAYDGPLPGGTPKGIELYVVNNIADLSQYGFGSANNGGGTDGEEFTFPAVPATAGQFIYIANESTEFTNWFGFAPDYTSGAANINGDDAIELFYLGGVIDVFGDINVDGTGEPWEYMDGWAYRNNGTGPDGTTFQLGSWSFSGPNALDGETTNGTATMPFPAGTYTPPIGPIAVTLTVQDDATGATSTCMANVTVQDNIAPTASCVGSYTVVLDGTGNGSLTGADIDGGSTDNCGVTTLSASPNTFTCADIGTVNVTLTVTDASGNMSTCNTTVTVDGSSVVSASVDAVIDVDCNGNSTGFVDVTTAGGTTPYSWDWNAGTYTTEDLTGVPAGTYNLTVTDAAGCTGTASATVNEPAPVSVTMVSRTNVSCNGAADGTIDIDVTGGVTPYTYLWTPTGQTTQDVTGLSGGCYDVTVTDANGCIGMLNVCITEPAALVATVDMATDPSSCGGADGSVTVTTTGGTTPYGWDWNSGTYTTEDITGLAAGTYNLTVTDANGCTATANASLSDPGGPNVTVDLVTDATCNGDSDGAIDVTTTGGTTPYGFDWNSGTYTTEDLSGLPAGTYNLTVTDAGGCTGTANATVSEPSPIDTSVTVAGTMITANAGGLSYQWLDCGSMTPLAGETAQSYTAIANGSYAVIVIDGACQDTSSCYTYTSIGIDEPGTDNGFALYPNPTNGQVTIELAEVMSSVAVEVLDIEGRVVINRSMAFGSVIILDAAILERGTYIIRITTDQGTYVDRLIRN